MSDHASLMLGANTYGGAFGGWLMKAFKELVA